MKDAAIQEVDFIVVGAGPIGAALALSLADISSSTSVVLLDQLPQPVDLQSYDSKVFAINSGSRQLFEDLDVWQDILDARACAYERMYIWDSEGSGSVAFDADELGVSQLGFIVEAGIIQSALNRRIALCHNIQVCRPAQISKIDWLDERAYVDLDSGERFIASLVCAADGARSTLRAKAAIATSDEDCGQQALVANVQLSLAHENCAWQIFRPTGPLAFLPLASDSEDQCSIVWTLDTEQAERIRALDNSQFLLELERAVEGRFGALQLTSERRLFPLQQKHALEYGVPGLVLVGDAAHSIHPLAGLGANLGFQDVVALAKELRRANKRGIAYGHGNIVSRYQRQRRLDNEMTLKAMTFFRTAFADHGMPLNALRNIGLKAFSHFSILKKRAARQALMSE